MSFSYVPQIFCKSSFYSSPYIPYTCVRLRCNRMYIVYIFLSYCNLTSEWKRQRRNIAHTREREVIIIIWLAFKRCFVYIIPSCINKIKVFLLLYFSTAKFIQMWNINFFFLLFFEIKIELFYERHKKKKEK